MESHQISGITLEYRRECGSSDIVQSLCQPDEDEIHINGMNQDSDISLLNGFSIATDILDGSGLLGHSWEKGPIRYTHLLQTKAENRKEEIVKRKKCMEEKG